MIPKIIAPGSQDFDCRQLSILPMHRRGVDSHYLMKAAKEAGGPDNVTVIVVRATGPIDAQGTRPETLSGKAAGTPATSWWTTRRNWARRSRR